MGAIIIIRTLSDYLYLQSAGLSTHSWEDVQKVLEEVEYYQINPLELGTFLRSVLAKKFAWLYSPLVFHKLNVSSASHLNSTSCRIITLNSTSCSHCLIFPRTQGFQQYLVSRICINPDSNTETFITKIKSIQIQHGIFPRIVALPPHHLS